MSFWRTVGIWWVFLNVTKLMSTRSNIGIVNGDGSVKAIYCHFDGYPAYVGRILLEHYNVVERIEELIDGGDMSSLKTNTTWESTFKEDAYTNTREEQPLYYYERGDIDDDSVYPKHFKNHQQMYKLPCPSKKIFSHRNIHPFYGYHPDQ